MAKTLKRINYVILRSSSGAPNDYASCDVCYSVGSSDDSDLSKEKVVTKTLSGGNLTNAQNLWAALKAIVESDESI